MTTTTITSSMKTRSVLALLLAAGSVGACTDDAASGDEVDSTSGTATSDAGDTSETTGTTGEGTYSLANCESSVAAEVAPFYGQYFACSAVTKLAASTQLATTGLPPHPSAYYPVDDPNYVEFDDRGGTHHKNPNTLAAGDYELVIPDAPIAKGITIDAALVDNTMNTSAEEYAGGPVGVALNGVVIFAAMAAPGDDLIEEQFTFDSYEAHPAMTTYHYHFSTPGPLEVLVDRGYSDSSTPGAGSVELYGIMCDGALVLGCTELDGSAPASADFDAQNGHLHDISDGQTTHFTNRYHTHVCPGQWPGYVFFPEIAYYETTNCPKPGP